MEVVVAAVLVLLVVVVAAALVVRGRRSGSPDSPGMATLKAAKPQAKRAEGLGSKVRSLFGAGAGEDAWGGLEDLLVRADVGPGMSTRIVADLKDRYRSGDDPAQLLEDEVVRILGEDPGLDFDDAGLTVIMVVGVNGSGKTTTIGKLATLLAAQGKKVSLAGSDTFRAAAGEQLETWAERSGAHTVTQARGADPGSVAFDGVKSAQARGSDVLIVDTAGRLHTRTPLMDELQKVKRVLEKAGGDVEEVVLVLDATTGQNGIAQARAFTEAVQVTGVALTKLDGTAKGGIVLAVREELGVPVKLVGTGEGRSDLELFDPKVFAERLVNG